MKSIKTEAPDPVTDQVVPLFHPRQMILQEHFSWNEDATQMIGITPTGRNHCPASNEPYWCL